jgi:uncharacterized protein
MAITEIRTLLASISPELRPGTFVFVSLEAERHEVLAETISFFREPEGISYIVPLDCAVRLGLNYSFPCRLVTLRVQSSLSAVGFLAAIEQRLAGKEIPVNAVSAFHHDHLFVPVDRADETVAELNALAREASQ